MSVRMAAASEAEEGDERDPRSMMMRLLLARERENNTEDTQRESER